MFGIAPAYSYICAENICYMTPIQIFHTVLFYIFGIVSLCEVKGARSKSRKYISLAIGILSLLIALYDTLVAGFGVKIF